jgi:mono/diheme cytochrome c family protein
MTKRWVLGFGLAAALMAANRPAPPWEKSRLSVGQDLFRENCAVFHDIEKPVSKKLGPTLHNAFKREKLASGAKPSRLYIITRIKFGGALMPAFAKKMTDAEMETLVDFIASR